MKTLTEFSTLILRRAAAARAARAGEALEGDALIAAIAGDLALPEDRVRRLIEALDVVGDVEKVRLVRVFQGEKGPIGATSVGEFHYVVDRLAAPERRRRDDRGTVAPAVLVEVDDPVDVRALGVLVDAAVLSIASSAVNRPGFAGGSVS